jgi:membrane protein
MGPIETSDRGSIPEPNDSRKPSGLTDIEPRTWKYVARKSWREFTDDQCQDLAAALTYYGVLSIFPAALALTALLALVGEADRSVKTVVDVLDPLVSEQTLGTVEPVLNQLANSQSAGLTLILGLVVALWTACGYVGAFSRAMLERGRQLQGGIKAELDLQLPPRDTQKIDKDSERAEEDEAEGRKIRRAAARRSQD